KVPEFLQLYSDTVFVAQRSMYPYTKSGHAFDVLWCTSSGWNGQPHSVCLANNVSCLLATSLLSHPQSLNSPSFPALYSTLTPFWLQTI
ncbi:hypothetical protein ACTXT7_010538, partial [Hymenolepis weldensis]